VRAADRAARRRVLVVVGTRPEAIKMAPVLRALQQAEATEVRLVLTGQHSDLVDEVLETFSLRPDWDLAIMKDNQTLTGVGQECLGGMARILGEWTPDMVLVQGDTASVFFSSLAAFLQGDVAIGHVEAGLRTGNLRQPFPEEAFRRLTAVLADLHFAPTPGARDNLLREGVPADRIHVTGNTGVDALLEVERMAKAPSSPILQRLILPGAPPFLLLTAHRRESFGGGLERVFRAVRALVDESPELEVLFPVHPNPAVVDPARRVFEGAERIHTVAPLAYSDLVAAIRQARAVLTDSGGIQEEAPTFGTPVLVLRDVTERPEGIQAGVARLVGTDPDRITHEVRRILKAPSSERIQLRKANPYGDGRAGPRIAEAVTTFLEKRHSIGRRPA